jgi:hypothetical protein
MRIAKIAKIAITAKIAILENTKPSPISLDDADQLWRILTK